MGLGRNVQEVARVMVRDGAEDFGTIGELTGLENEDLSKAIGAMRQTGLLVTVEPGRHHLTEDGVDIGQAVMVRYGEMRAEDYELGD